MSRSNNRNLSDIANPNNNLISVSNNDVTITGAGVTQYDSADLLPSAGVNTGTQAYVAATGKLYIRGDGGWYNIATVNQTPNITSILDSGGNAGPFVLAKDGSTTTITTTATDPEGFPITFTATPNSDFNNMASVSIDSSGGRIFTITPQSEDSATTTSGTITFKASDGVNIASAVSTFSLSFTNIIVSNRHTLVLAKASGNNGVNSTFTDASSSGHTITGSGDVQGQTFSPYRSGGYYTEFDGTDDQFSVTTPAHTSFDFGTGNFTIECWFWIDAAGDAEETMFQLKTSPSGQYTDSILINHRDGYGIAAFLNTGSVGSALHGHDDTTMGSESSVASTDWTHLAIVRNSDTITLYLNGKSVDSGSYSGQDFTNQSEIIFGGSNNDNFHGKLFDLRIVKGTAVYTADFTVPTTFLESISGTSLLTFRTAVPYDESSNSHALTVTSRPRGAPQNTIYDYLNYSISANSGSVYLDGSGDHITIPWSSDFEFGSGDFTIEMWYNLSDIEGLISWGADASNRFDITGLTNTQIRVLYNSSSYTNFDDRNGNDASTNTWQHFACARENDNLRYFINGVLQATVAMSTGAVMPNDSSNGITIGARRYATTYSDRSIGYISNLRILKGTALYTAAFTPPTSPLADITNTKLLAFQGNNLSVFDPSQNTGLILGTGIKSSTTQTKNASSSIVFDDSGDGLTGVIEAIGTDTFTIEGWFYAGTQGTNNRIFSTGGNNHAGGFSLVLRTNGEIQLQAPGGTSVYQSGSYADSAWHHFALVRVSGSTSVTANKFNLFIDGASVYSADLSTDLTATDLYIGHSNGSLEFGGYIEDFRISKGIARYPFAILPTTLTSDSNTFCLAAHSSSATDVVGDWTVTTPDTGTPTVSDFAPFAGGKSLRFTSNDDMLLFTHTGSSSDYLIGDRNDNAAGNFSIEFWAYYDATSIGSTTYMVSNYGGGSGASSGQTFMLGYRTSGTNLLQYRVNSASGSGSTNATQITNGATFKEWTHHYIVQEYDGSLNTYVRYYIDGVSVHNYTKTTNDPLDMQRFVIGSGTGSGTSGGNYWNGYISNFRIQTGTVAHPNTAQLKYALPTAEILG